MPFFMRWPAKISAGSNYNGVASQTDLLATFADIIDVKLSDNEAEDSVSLLPVLENPSNDLKRSAIISHASSGRFAISDGQWKLIMPHGKLGFELYHLTQDPRENTNLYGKHDKIQNRLEKRITAMVQSVGPLPERNKKTMCPGGPI